jgi:hypothetical protein
VVGVGIDEVEKIGVMIYPNPVKNKLNVVTNGTLEKITITDTRGVVVYQGTSQSIDVSSFAQGIYFVKVETAQGSSVSKFIRN